MMTFKLPMIAAAALAAAVLLPGCSDDEEIAYGGSPPGVRVVDEVSRSAIAGIKIVVMDPTTNEPVGGPRITDENGLCLFPELEVGRYPVLAYGGIHYRVVSFNPDLLEVIYPPSRKDSYGLTGPGYPDKTATAPDIPPLVVLAVPVNVNLLPRFSGRVVDSVTGLPLEAAFIGLSPWLTGYEGNTSPNDDVTNGEGIFSVSGIPVGIDPDSGNLFQLQSLLVVRHGYQPTYWRHQFPNGSQNIDVKDVTIALDPVGPADTGVLHGRILKSGEPVAGLPVGLAVNALGNKTGPGLTGWGAVTDHEGRYRIKGLPGGSYIVQPGYLLGDGAVFPFPPGFMPFPVMPGAETDAGDLAVLQEIRPIQPHEGVVLARKPDILIWTSVPGAKEYEVRFDRGLLARVEVSQYYIPEEMEISPGRHTWEVGAFANPDSLLGYGQKQFQFRIEEPQE